MRCYEARLRQMRETIAKNYIEGCIEYFDTFEPGPWQETEETLERAIESGDTGLILNQIVFSEKTFLELLEGFKKYKDIERLYAKNN